MTVSKFTTLPPIAGAGFKPQHFEDVLKNADSNSWFEVHAENYMSEGGPTLKMLERLRTDFEISIHGVGLSVGSAKPLNKDHLQRLKRLCDWINPASFSEHLAWSSHNVGFLNDLLPVPYTSEALTLICDHIDEVQEVLGRKMLLENPSSYLNFAHSTFEETEFLEQISTRTGCGLLLDINNVYVSSVNLGLDARQYLAAFPMKFVGEIHLAGHSEEQSDLDDVLLIDAHDRAVSDPVWELYRAVVGRIGPMPTLIEWDTDIPEWPILQHELSHANKILHEITSYPTETLHVA